MIDDGDKVLQVSFYKNSNNKKPIREWLLKLDKEDRDTIGSDLKAVEYGWPIGMPLCRSLGKRLYEVRSNLKNGRISRIIFCIKCNEMFILNGFIKKSQKTPKQEIELALKRMKEVLR